MKLLVVACLLVSSSAFAAPITCQSNDENVGGGNIRFVIESPRQIRGIDGHIMVVYPITASNQSKGITKYFDGVGSANLNGISLKILQDGDVLVGSITAKNNGVSLVGTAAVKGVTGSEEVSCWAAQ